MENAGTSFDIFVKQHINVDEQERRPVCPFKTCGECNTAYSEACYTCEFAKEAYKEEIEELRQHLEQEALVEKALQKVKEKRKGAKVFCVCCGAQKRTLRKWKNVYICSDCWKIKERIGEERFKKALMGEET